MKNRFYSILPFILLGAFLLVHFGCVSSPTPRFYLLSPMSTTGSELKSPVEERCLSLGIGPMKIPGYLDQTQIVTRSTANELVLAEFDRWAEPLSESFTRIISQNLSALLCTKTVVVFPWRGKIPVDYRIETDVLRFDGALGGQVSLEAWWRVFNGDGKILLLTRYSNFREPADSRDFKSLVAAQGRTLEKLSREIAEAIKTLSKK